MKERRGEHPFGDAGQLILAVIYLVVWGCDTFVFHWSTFLKAGVPEWIRDTLMALAAFGAVALFVGGRTVISGARPDHVVDSGPFHFVRHPLYLAALLGYFAFAVSSLSLIALALIIPVFFFYDFIAGYEQKLLEEKFGDAYRDYEARTGKWLPGLGRGRTEAVRPGR